MMKHKLTLGSLLLAGILTLAPTAVAATAWYVNGANGSDSNNCLSPTTACKTIGHAISFASSGDSISVAAATYTENLTIGLNLTILGSSAQTTIIDGGGVNTVVTNSNSSARVTLSQLTIRHGFAQNGGGIYSSGALIINQCVISGNSAKNSGRASGGGIYTAGALSIHTSSISGNSVQAGTANGVAYGGGIYASGLTIINTSTISGNSAIGVVDGGGGGIFSSGATLTINNSTISQNSVGNANSEGGSGGGIVANTLTINNSTVSGNSAQAGIPSGFTSGGGIQAYKATINNTTISGNSASGIGYSRGGGLSVDAYTPISNSTISGNTAGQGAGVYHYPGHGGGHPTFQNTIVANSPSGGNCLGPMISKGYNMSSDGTCNFSNSGDRNSTNPMLGTLGNYGGPTQTIPLLTGSPAIDEGNPSGCTDGSGHLLTTDQRGYPRHDPEDTGGCDMGAYERQTD
jgi:hypothetical protein